MNGWIYMAVPKCRMKKNILYGDYLFSGKLFSKYQLEEELAEYPENKRPVVRRVENDIASIMEILDQPPLMPLTGKKYTRINMMGFPESEFPVELLEYLVLKKHATRLQDERHSDVNPTLYPVLYRYLSPEAATIFHAYHSLLLQFIAF